MLAVIRLTNQSFESSAEKQTQTSTILIERDKIKQPREVAVKTPKQGAHKIKEISEKIQGIARKIQGEVAGETEKALKPLESPSKACPHYYGYLKTLPKDVAIPDECLACLRMVECISQ